MPKRKRSAEDYDSLRKKLKQIEKEIAIFTKQRSGKLARGRRRILSNSSSSPESSQSEPTDNALPRHASVEDDLDHMLSLPPKGFVVSSPTKCVPIAPQEPDTAMSVYDTIPENLEDNASELDADILQVLGVDPTKTEKFGKNIQKDVALRFEHTTTTGLSKEDRKELTERYLVPTNCKLVGAPGLNPEVKAALSEAVIKRDKVIASKQTLMATAIASLGEAITLILSSKDKNIEVLRTLMDTGRALCDCQHNDSITRRNYVIFSVKKDMKDSLQSTKIDDLLFGHNLSETLKAAKAINKSGAELKPPSTSKLSTNKQNQPSTSKNWKGAYPPRKQPTKSANPPNSTTTKSQFANSSRQSYNQRPVRTATHSRR